ncbi:MAG: RNA 2',3'-cyclic phosphodiesterase [Patescibacteria group bacterium]
MRCFLAINLPEETKEHLEDIILKIEAKNRHQEVKWTETEHLHLTLGFIEEIDQDTLKNIIIDLEALNVPKDFFLSLNRLGVFPNENSPRVIKISLLDNGNNLPSINSFIKNVFIKHNIPVDEHPFSPHITIGRVKRPGVYLRLDQTIKPISFSVNSIDLMKSELTSAGPIYTLLKSFR